MEFKYVDDLASVWCEYAEMELRHQNYKNALNLLRTATAAPPSFDRRQVRHPHQTLTHTQGPGSPGFAVPAQFSSRAYKSCSIQSIRWQPCSVKTSLGCALHEYGKVLDVTKTYKISPGAKILFKFDLKIVFLLHQVAE